MTIKKLLKKILLVLTLLLIGFIAFLLYQTKDDINADLTNIEAKLNRYYNPKRMGGFAVSVFNADSIIYSKGFGYSNKEDKKPYTTNTQQYIASISKTVIGIALMKAEELKLLTIDDPINKHLPFKIYNPHFPKDEITIKQLATHTSSLDYNELVVESLYIAESEKNKSLDSFMKAYFQQGEYGALKFTKFRPGSDWNYSNIGASLAAYIVEIVSGTSFADFTQAHIFDPLELNDTYWTASESDALLHTNYYESVGDSIANVQTSGVILYPSRDMITNIADLTKYCQAIISKNNNVLNSNSFNKLLSPQLNGSVTNLEDDNNGVFFMIDRNNYGITYQLTGMSGGDNCITTMMWFDPKTELGYIFLGNTGASTLNRSNHNWVYNALVSLGYNYTFDNATVTEKAKLKWHNLYNRIRALF
ncbi:serine hydrolase domain-containing protein [Winogradskyella flava]|uniref:serine hydrolase domain-containing protein n=1 Tax=Winogradskyella flava TaxID=1884876 RepID=UPI00248F4E81|nr:serine hydrolase domain-containing protein [Winogradskyella flava]